MLSLRRHTAPVQALSPAAGAWAMFGYFDGMIRYFELSGRSSRTQYWMFQLVMLVVTVAALFADYKFGGWTVARQNLGFFALFSCIIHTVPGVTVTVRRLHDSGHSGWWYWISLVPIVGSIWLLVLMFFGPDTNGANAYGPDPRETGSAGPAARPVKLSRAQQLIADMQARSGRMQA